MISLESKTTHINQLIERCKKNDSTAQMQVYNNYYKAMYNTAYRILKDEFERFTKNTDLRVYAAYDEYDIEKQKTEISREILLKSIQQYAGDVTSEVTTTLIPIPSDDIK